MRTLITKGRRKNEAWAGFALTAVLVTLAILMALLGPFLLSMTQSNRSANAEAAIHEAGNILNGNTRSLLAAMAAADRDPRVDGLDDFDVEVFEAHRVAEGPLGDRRITTAEIWDLQGRIHAPTAPLQIWANMTGRYAVLTANIAPDEEDIIQLSSTSGFDDEGYVWIGHELIHYDKKSSSGLEGLTRGVRSGESEVPDPFGPAAKHTGGSVVYDALTRLLVTWQFDEGIKTRQGMEPRSAFRPWSSLEELPRISEAGFGVLEPEELEKLRGKLAFHSGRPIGVTYGRKERVFNELEAMETNRLLVRDGAAFATGSVVRVQVGDQVDHALVIAHGRGGGRLSSVNTGRRMQLILDRPVRLMADEAEATVQPMRPVPLNINTCKPRTLAWILEGSRSFTQAQEGMDGANQFNLSPQLPAGKALAIATRLVQLRGPVADEDEKTQHPYENWEDLVVRAILPMHEVEGLLSKAEVWNLYNQILNGSDAWRLHTAGIPISFSSSGLVAYRVAVELLSGSGRTLAERELRGIAMPQPNKTVDRFWTTQADFDEVSRLTGLSFGYMSAPFNTHIRLRGTSGEPPNQTLAHWLGWMHGSTPKFPSKDSSEGWIRQALAREYDYGPENMSFSYSAGDHPDGRDLAHESPPDIQADMPPIPGRRKSKTSRGQAEAQAAHRRGRNRKVPMMIADDLGLGIGFGISAWFKPRSLKPAALFEIAARGRGIGAEFENRILASIEAEEILLRLYDMAGQDPEPSITSPDETALVFRVPISGNGILADTWFHLGIEVQGGTPSSIFLTTDGAPKGRADFISYLTHEIAEFDVNSNALSGDNQSYQQRVRDALYPEITIEDAESFPEAGVVRIGMELFEYTSKSGNTLQCRRVDSRGGRLARRDSGEFRRGTNDPSNPGRRTQPVTLPGHMAGVAVELYGYSNPLLEGQPMISGEASLVSKTLARWGVARVVTARDDIILTNGDISIVLGKGIDENFTGKLDLVEPELPANNRASKNLPGFEEGGGYALLIQAPRRITLQNPRSQLPDIVALIGGVELIRYTGFDGKSIQVAGRRDRFREAEPDLKSGRMDWFPGKTANGTTGGRFVGDWRSSVFAGIVDPDDFPQMWLFCMPISLSISGLDLVDPARLGYSEWLQVYPKDNPTHTEWVRYDTILDNKVLRTRLSAVQAVMFALTGFTTTRELVTQGGPLLGDLSKPIEWRRPPTETPPQIGTPDVLEDAASYEARLAFRFRGDPGVHTATHLQGASSIVTPVFRTVISQFSLPLGRPGREDRIAVLSPGVDSMPRVKEWHSINWTHRLWSVFDQQAQQRALDNRTGRLVDPVGPRGNLVALKDGLRVNLIGARLVHDTRRMPRIVKFPSGELPMRLSQRASIGAAAGSNPPNFDGLVDDVQGYSGFRLHPFSIGVASEILGTVAAAFSATETTILVTASPINKIEAALNGGGLLWCDGELMGFVSADIRSGKVELAPNGRGMLGTERRAHDVGARIIFVEHMRSSALEAPCPVASDIIMVGDPSHLPRAVGTLLLGQELMHYTWSSGNLLQMPRKRSDDNSSGGGGLFRGRFGTIPQAHAQGDIAIAWPIRYMDRYAPRSEDPELAHFDFSIESPDLYMTQVLWEEEVPEKTIDLILLARADERVPFSADPQKSPGLWLFDDPENKKGELGRFIRYQASRWDFRFHVRYLSGAFNPIDFNATAWKRSARVRSFGFSYEAQTQILSEYQSLR